MVASRSCSQRQLRRTLDPLVARAATIPGADRYRKRFPALAHLWILLLHVLWQSPSLRSTHATLTTSTCWWQRWGMPTAISLSQLARSSSSRPSTCLDHLLADVLAIVRSRPTADQTWQLLQRTAILDSTFVRLSACLSPWSSYGGYASGIRLQTLFEVGRQIPASLRMTLADINDHTALWELELTAWRGWTLLLDRGYYGHRQLGRLRAAGVSFIARKYDQARYTILEQRAVPEEPTPEGDTIQLDAIIRLGSANNRGGTVLSGLRLVISGNRHGQELALVTDRHDLSASEIVQLYRKRWQIELFFRWLKRQLGLIHPLGRSRAAVWMTVVLVMVVAVLSQMLEPLRPKGMSRCAWLQHLAMTLYVQAITDD